MNKLQIHHLLVQYKFLFLCHLDQYFYYMLYNGYLQHSIASIAPDKFWKKRVDKVMRGYFDRLVFVANDAQMAALKKAYGTWASFQESLKEFQNKQ